MQTDWLKLYCTTEIGKQWNIVQDFLQVKMTEYEEKCYKAGQHYKYIYIYWESEKCKLRLLKQKVLKKLVGKMTTHFMYMERKQALITQKCPDQQISDEMYE